MPDKVYIAGPMRGWQDYNYPAFAEAAAYYRTFGVTVISPPELDAERGIDVASMTRSEVDAIFYDLINDDLKRLASCTHICCLPHYQESQGAQMEVAEAKRLGLLFTYYKPEAPMIRSTETPRTFSTGATRNSAEGKPRPDLRSPYAAERVGLALLKGAKDHAPRNWEQGMPISECVASVERHIMRYKMGWTDEDHLANAICNLEFIAHYEAMIKLDMLPAELDDMPRYEKYIKPMDATKLPLIRPEEPAKVSESPMQLPPSLPHDYKPTVVDVPMADDLAGVDYE